MNQFLQSLSERSFEVSVGIQPRSSSRFERAGGPGEFDFESRETDDRHDETWAATVADLTEPTFETGFPARARQPLELGRQNATQPNISERLEQIVQPVQTFKPRATTQATLTQQAQGDRAEHADGMPRARSSDRGDETTRARAQDRAGRKIEHNFETILGNEPKPEGTVPSVRHLEATTAITPRERSMIEPRTAVTYSRHEPDRQPNRQPNRQTDRQTDRQTTNQTERIVHVTIGRLEVRVQAPTSTATGTPKARPESKIMGLEEYLARRDRGSA
jgi:hypothetical protein